MTDEGSSDAPLPEEEAEPPSLPEPLDARLERGAVDFDEVLAIARMLASYLDAEHAAGRVDGRLAPYRIEVRPGEAPRLIEAEPGRVVIEAYVAPEAWDEGSATPQSDQFAMAAILYEALCGGRAFPGDDVEKIRKSITTGSRVPLAARVPGLADAIDGVFEKAFGLDPAERYPSCTAFADALVAAVETSRAASVLVQRPISSRPSARRPPRWVDFEDDQPPPPLPWVKVLGALILLALIAAGLASLTK